MAFVTELSFHQSPCEGKTTRSGRAREWSFLDKGSLHKTRASQMTWRHYCFDRETTGSGSHLFDIVFAVRRRHNWRKPAY